MITKEKQMFELTVLGNLYNRGVITEEVYDKAVRKLTERQSAPTKDDEKDL